MIIKISGKVSDMFGIRSDGIDYNGYVPSGLGIGGGDYISFSLDTETGIIQNWKPLDNQMVRGILFAEDEDEE
jgi:hypothetical protein